MAIQAPLAESESNQSAALPWFRGPWRYGFWLAALFICALFFVWEWIWLDNLPTALTELQYAGNQNTARQVMDAWGEVGITPDRIQAAVLLDIPGLLLTGLVLALAAKRAEPYFRDGAHEWKNYVIGGAAIAALCGLIGDLTLCAFLSDPLKHPAALPWVFFLITLKTFLFSAAALYAASGFGQSWWAGGFWDATRACGFSLFAALVGPGLLAFGHQGAAIFGVISGGLSPNDPNPPASPKPHADYSAYLLYYEVTLRHYRSLADVRPYGIALLAILFFSLMCWGAARYAVTYKEKEANKEKGGRANQKGANTRYGSARASHGFLFYFLTPSAGTSGAHEDERHAKLRREENQQKGWDVGETWVPRFCGLVPSILITLIIVLADATDIQSKWSAMGVGIIGGLVATIIWQHAGRRGKAEKSDGLAQTTFARKFSRAYKFATVLGAIFGSVPVLVGCFGNGRLMVALDCEIGPLAAWFFSFAMVVPFFTWLVTAGRRYGKPLLASVLAYGFLINAADLNDDHGLRYVALPYTPQATGGAAPTDPAAPKTLNQAFDDWLTTDGDVARWRATHPGLSYPVVFVAAAGGGIVAGGVVTATMAEVQQNPNTANLEDHLFAISSVSGGSLGAVTYAALRGGGLDANGQSNSYSDAAEQVMITDMLSPSVESLFGPEMVQRFLPFAVPIPKNYRDGFTNGFALDRGRALVGFHGRMDELSVYWSLSCLRKNSMSL